MNLTDQVRITKYPGHGALRGGLPRSALFVLALATMPQTVLAQGDGRSGKEVVDASCVSCHGTGVKGAPKIGDSKAWSKRAEQGLSSLTQSALKGIRQMPPHGGNPGLTDIEIERAITYMVNQSGGQWTEPISRASVPALRTGEQIVSMQCARCHETGAGGAPKIGDRAAWVPRLKQGLDPLVRSAINGHGGMPPRGGAANLTDAELRSAIIAMFYAGTAEAKAGAAESGVSGTNLKVVEGVAVYFGIIAADAIRGNSKEYPRSVYGVPPSAPEQYYVNVSLYDANNGKRITDATVRARVSTPAGAGPEKTLEAMSVPNSLTYGNYFAMAGSGPYQITLHIKRPGMIDAVTVQFEHAH